jgi:hypothetical protein
MFAGRSAHAVQYGRAMRFAAPLLLVLPLVAACAVADEPPQVESDASDCASILSCGCTPGTTYTCPSSTIVVTCQDGGVWPESPCMPGDASFDGAVGDATTDVTDASTSHAPDANDAAPDSPAD